jgi:hypothetical protein
MRRKDRIGRLAIAIMEPVARWRAEEVAYQMGRSDNPNYWGKVVRLVMEPLCWVIGMVVTQRDWRVLYAGERG